MSCSLQQQPSGPGLPPVVHTTVVPFTNYSQWERRSTKAPAEGNKATVSGKTRPKQKSLASSKTTVHCYRHAPREQSIIISTRPQQEDGRTLGSSVKNRTGYTTSQPSTTRSESATRLRLLRVSPPCVSSEPY